MRIAVIGAGIVGVTTAYELAADGHEVSVFERLGSVAAGDSFAPGGVMAPGLASPWTAPAAVAPWKVWARQDESPYVFARGADSSARRWASAAAKAVPPHVALHRLATFSQQRVHEIGRRHRLDWERSEGVLVLMRSRDDRRRVEPGIALLDELGVRFDKLDPAGCRAVEPGLDPETPLYGAIHLPDAESGNCRQFANLLRAELPGVQFRYHTEVQRIVPGRRPQIVRMYAPPEEASLAAAQARSAEGPPTQPTAHEPVTEDFHAVVVCAGSQATSLLAPHGTRLPLQPVWGYSVTAPIRLNEQHPDQAPRATIVDIARGISIGRIGSRLRAAGVQELGGTSEHDAASLEGIYADLNDWFPGVARLNQALAWKGARPGLADGAPAIGASAQPGIWLNVGHGAHGWALACGSARLLADQIAGRKPAVDADAFNVARLLAW